MGAALSVVKLDSSLFQRKEVQIGAISFIVSAIVLKVIHKVTSNEKPKPPGPWGFPIIGHLPLLGKEPNITFMNMRERFGDIFQIRMGSWDTVVVHGKNAIKEVLIKRIDDFGGRPTFESTKFMAEKEGFGFGVTDEEHRLHRKIFAKLLLDFSSPHKSPLEDMINNEVDILMKDFQSRSGRFDPKEPLTLCVSSVIYQICYGYQENIRETDDFAFFLRNNENFTKFFSAGNPVDVIPWLKYIMPWKITQFASLMMESFDLRNKKVNEHYRTYSKNNKRDIVDGLITIVKEGTPLSERRIISTVDAVFGAGLGTVSASLVWIARLMAEHPRIQERVQKELDEVVGNSRRPTIQDKEKMVYTEAVLHEVNRYASLSPLNFPYFTLRDTELCGYRIKKNTVVFTNLYSMNYDKNVWGDPDVFRPERFLDGSGQINKALLEEFIPFSIGRRRCLGESLAKTELFLFFTGILQRCSIMKPPEIREYTKGAKFGIARQCYPFEIQVKPRY